MAICSLSLATAIWDPWDASPPTLEIMGTKCIWSPPTFATACHFCWGIWELRALPPNLVAGIKRDGDDKRRRKGNGCNWRGGALRVDEEGMKEEKIGDRYPPHLMSPPTFQQWLRLCPPTGQFPGFCATLC